MTYALRLPMGIHSINSIMKSMVHNSPLQNIDNRIANHSTREILAKKLRQNHHNPKSFLLMDIPEKQVRIPMTVKRRSSTVSCYIIDSKEASGSIRQHVMPHSNPILQNLSLSFFSGPQLQNDNGLSTNLPYDFYERAVNFNVTTYQLQSSSSSMFVINNSKEKS